jgi:trypsin
MIRVATALACLTVSIARAHAIVGEASIADAAVARHAVMIRGSQLQCTAVPLTQDLVLTAAHCMIDRSNSKIVGDLKDGIAVAETVRYPQYNPELPVVQRRRAPDVALLKLAKPLPTRFAPAFVDWQTAAVGDRVIVVGYGQTTQNDWKLADAARMARLLIVSQTASRLVLSERFGLHEDGSLAACKGDSGAPVFLERGDVPALVGIVSGSTVGCSGFTTITPLAPQREWLVETARMLGSPLAP